MNRFTISKHPTGYYQVSIPSYPGGEVVTAEAFDALVETLKAARTWLAGLAVMHRFNGQSELIAQFDIALTNATQE